MKPDRPILLCIIQFQDQIEANQMSVADAIERAAFHGVQGIELRREVWPNYADEIEATAQLLRERGLVGTFATFSRLFTADEATHAQLLRDIEAAARLGSPFLRIFQGDLPPDESDVDWEKAYRAIAYAESLGIQLALENFGGPPGHRATDIKLVLDRLDSPTLVTNFDIGNYFAAQEDIDAAVELLSPKVVCVHLKDNSGDDNIPAQPLGAGVMPIAAILNALDALPQDVYYCLEFGGGDNADDGIAQSIRFLEAHWASNAG